MSTPKVRHISDPNCPKEALYIGRATPRHPASKYANPFQIGALLRRNGATLTIDRASAIRLFRAYAKEKLRTGEWTVEQIREDVKHGVVCWCWPLPCHGDVLLELAHEGEVSDP